MIRSVTTILALLSFGPALQAQIVALDNGRHLSAESVRAEGELLHLTLRGGGKMTISLSSVSRVLAPELATAEEIEELTGIETTHRSWRFDPEREPLFRSRWDGWIYHLAKEYDVDAALISAVIRAESDFDPTVVSHKGARGLMQLMPATARRFGVDNSFNPVENMRGGVRYLSWLIDEMDGDIERVLAGYNAGEGNVRRYDGVPPFRETVNYVSKILGWLDHEPSAQRVDRRSGAGR